MVELHSEKQWENPARVGFKHKISKKKKKKSTALNTEQCSLLLRSCTNLRRHSAGNELDMSLSLGGTGLNWEIKLISPE